MRSHDDDPYDIPVITRRARDNAAGSRILVQAAEREGVMRFTTKATGRQFTTARDFAALLAYVEKIERVLASKP